MRYGIYSDFDIFLFYFFGFEFCKVYFFGFIYYFKNLKKLVEVGNVKRCLECVFEKDCVWSVKKIYIDGLKDEEYKVRFIL